MTFPALLPESPDVIVPLGRGGWAFPVEFSVRQIVLASGETIITEDTDEVALKLLPQFKDMPLIREIMLEKYDIFKIQGLSPLNAMAKVLTQYLNIVGGRDPDDNGYSHFLNDNDSVAP